MTISANNGDKVTFQLVAPNIIKNNFTNCTSQGIVTYEVARQIDTELRNKHSNLYPFFKDKVNSVDDPNYTSGYLMVLLTNGVLVPVGVPWINEDTFSVVSSETRVYTFPSWMSKYESSLHDLLANLGAQYSYTTTKK